MGRLGSAQLLSPGEISPIAAVVISGELAVQDSRGCSPALGHKQPALCCLLLLIVCIFRFISCKFAVFCGLCKNL